MFNLILKWITTTDCRLNRLQFLLIFLFNIIGIFLVWLLLQILFDPSNVQYDNYNLFLKVPFLTIWFISSINRFHDMNKSWWYILLELVPFLNILIIIWLLVWKWTEWKNNYWEDPLSTKKVD